MFGRRCGSWSARRIATMEPMQVCDPILGPKRIHEDQAHEDDKVTENGVLTNFDPSRRTVSA